MIVRIEGVLETISQGAAVFRVDGGLTYEVLISAYTEARLGSEIGKTVTLFTLHYFESLNQGGTLIPRLAGFARQLDRQFFDLFTTCKGIGQRKALRAMTLDTAQIAAAIADRDALLLQSLPEIGKRTAETIIATLHGKVDAFLSPSDRLSATGGPNVSLSTPGPETGMLRETLEVLVQLGESRAQSLQWIDKAMREDDPPLDSQELLARVYELKPSR